ncbi:MAG: hypothetical protein ACHQ4H_11525 [Ktedonobacterales bacterium]
MEPNEILAIARSDHVPGHWHVWPLRRDVLQRDALEWALYALFGFVLFIPALLLIVPALVYDGIAQHWGALAVLGVTGGIALGSLAFIGGDLLRWLRASQYLLVMTPDDFVKQEPRGRVTHVPMEAVADAAVKGLPDPGAALAVTREIQRSSVVGFTRGDVLTGRTFRQPRRTPSLAFRDTRTGKTVTVATDNAFDDLWALFEILEVLADAKARQIQRAREG